MDQLREVIHASQRVIENWNPSLGPPIAPPDSVPLETQNFLDRQCDALIVRTAVELKKAIQGRPLPDLTRLVDDLSNLIFFPISVTALDMAKAASEMRSCFQELKERIGTLKLSPGSNDEMNFLRLFTFSFALTAMASPGDVQTFLNHTPVGIFPQHQDEINNWLKRLLHAPSPVVRRGLRDLETEIMTLSEMIELSGGWVGTDLPLAFVEEENPAPMPSDWGKDPDLGFSGPALEKRKTEVDDAMSDSEHSGLFFAKYLHLVHFKEVSIGALDYGGWAKEFNNHPNGRLPHQAENGQMLQNGQA
jgi:hypothetical protein